MNGPTRPLPAFAGCNAAAKIATAGFTTKRDAVGGRSPAVCQAGLLLISAALAMMLAGCQTPAAPFDPFLAGRNTIPPPGTAVQASPAPYYNGAPPTVTVPAPGAAYTVPGAAPIAAPAVAPAVTVPASGGGQLPRGISAPQSSIQKPSDNTQLAAWQPSGIAESPIDEAESSPLNREGDPKNGQSARLAWANDGNGQQSDESSDVGSGVVRASFEATSAEPPIRIVEPPDRIRPAKKDANKLNSKQTTAPPSSPGRKTTSSQRLPELTDFPPADGQPAAKWRPGS